MTGPTIIIGLIILSCLCLFLGALKSYYSKLTSAKRTFSIISFIVILLLNLSVITPALNLPWMYLQVIASIVTFVFIIYLAFTGRKLIIFLVPQVALIIFWVYFVKEFLPNGIGSMLL